MAEEKNYDLTSKLGAFMDRHMLIPLLDFLKVKQQYPEAELQSSKLDILLRTNMVDLAMDIHKELHTTSSVPKEMATRREEVVANMQKLQGDVQPILELVQDQGLVNNLRSEKLFTPAYLQQQYSITPANIEVLHSYAKFVYDCGQYQNASYLLASYRSLASSPDRIFSALWGKLSSEILLQNWDQALDDLQNLRDTIENRPSTSPLMQLQQRCWVMHWSLFLLGNHPNGRNVVAELFFQEKYLNAIQTNAPHLLRYLAVAVITNPRRRQSLKELVRVIAMERANYTDPILQFLEDLNIDCNFDNAQDRLTECATLIDNDFFLSNSERDFLTNARLLIFENYCRIHQRIDLKMLAKKLSMEQIAAEKWIVKMVSDAQLNAKIDAQSGHVILGVQPPDVYQQVIDKTKGLSFRSYVLAQNLTKL